MKGCPYDNAVVEDNFKVFKAEFVRRQNFANSDQWKLELVDYVLWFNHVRMHSSLVYRTLSEYRAMTL